MVLLALAMELAAGLALHDARHWGQESGENGERLAKELEDIHAKMVACLYELTVLENEPAEFTGRFKRDFYRSMLTHTLRSAMNKHLVVALGLLFVLPHSALAADRLNLVVLVDLSQSVAVKGHDGKTEMEKNFTAVTRLLAQVLAGTHLTVLGITDNSFAQPYILLSADVATDEGYFHEKLASARQQLVRNWHSRAEHLQVGFSHTDILGALMLADQLFHEKLGGWRDVLIIFSDMRPLEAKSKSAPGVIA
jgi:hypothetical protein